MMEKYLLSRHFGLFVRYNRKSLSYYLQIAVVEIFTFLTRFLISYRVLLTTAVIEAVDIVYLSESKRSFRCFA